jgi:hypothetical protein
MNEVMKYKEYKKKKKKIFMTLLPIVNNILKERHKERNKERKKDKRYKRNNRLRSFIWVNETPTSVMKKQT